MQIKFFILSEINQKKFQYNSFQINIELLLNPVAFWLNRNEKRLVFVLYNFHEHFSDITRAILE